MKAIISEKAIVLKKIPYGESDCIISFLTERDLKLTAYASGERKSNKRFGGVLDLFCPVFIQTKPARVGSLCRLDMAEAIDHFERAPNLQQLGVLSFVAEVVMEFLQEDQVIDGLFDFVNRLIAPDTDIFNEASWHSILPHLQYNLLSLFGYKPVLDRCLSCGQMIQKNIEMYYFDSFQGGVLCFKCLHGEAKELSGRVINHNGVRHNLKSSVIAKLTQSFENQALEAKSQNWNADEIAMARCVLESFLQQTLGKPLKSLQFLADISQ